MPYAIIKHDMTNAYWLLSIPNSLEMPGHITAKALRSIKLMTVAIVHQTVIKYYQTAILSRKLAGLGELQRPVSHRLMRLRILINDSLPILS
jgi:hypothetical protein